MQEDPFPAAERILSDIESIFQKDPELKEFDILPITLNQNKSPVHHVENCLGLELWCVRHVYCYAYHRLFDMRQQRNRRADPEVQARLLMGALLINPDVQTFWNMRRELLQACRLDCHAELHFTSVVLSRKPKCAEAFSYRKWIVTKLKSGGEKEHCLLSRELQVARTAANRYANNYHAWQHCIWSLVHLAPCDTCPETYIEEWTASKMWVTMHVSDHSGWQYRQYLLQQLCGPLAEKIHSTSVEDHLYDYIHPVLQIVIGKSNDVDFEQELSEDEEKTFQYSHGDDIVAVLKECSSTSIVQSLKFVLSEIDLSTDLITRYPGHEALWYHRRFLLSFIKSLLDFNTSNANNGGEKLIHRKECDYVKHRRLLLNSRDVLACAAVQTKGEVSHDASACNDTHVLFEKIREVLCLVAQALPYHEKRLVSSCVGADSNQQRFCAQYNKWLVQVLGLSIAC